MASNLLRMTGMVSGMDTDFKLYVSIRRSAVRAQSVKKTSVEIK